MARKTRSSQDAQLDVFEAVKRAFIRRGFVRKKRKRATHSQAPVTKVTTLSPVNANKVEPAEGPERLVDLTASAHEVLLKANTVFPFTLFPDTVTIDREKLTIANRAFFKVATINSMPITDIQSVQAHIGPFFGGISILRKNIIPTAVPLVVKFLWRDDATKVQRLLQGYVIAHQKKVDCATIDKEQLLILLNDLGQGVSD